MELLKEIWVHVILKFLSPINLNILSLCSKKMYNITLKKRAKWKRFSIETKMFESGRKLYLDVVDAFLNELPAVGLDSLIYGACASGSYELFFHILSHYYKHDLLLHKQELINFSTLSGNVELFKIIYQFINTTNITLFIPMCNAFLSHNTKMILHLSTMPFPAFTPVKGELNIVNGRLLFTLCDSNGTEMKDISCFEFAEYYISKLCKHHPLIKKI